MLRLSGGELNGHEVEVPNAFIRPMMGMVRQSLFSSLMSMGALDESTAVLDLFAGSGLLGLEGLSRGARNATFVDASARCKACIEKNCERLGFTERSTVVEAFAEDVLAQPPKLGGIQQFQLVTMAPPYTEINWPELMQVLVSSPALVGDSVVVIEYPLELGMLPQRLGGRLVGWRNKRFGRTVLATYVCEPAHFDVQKAKMEEFGAPGAADTFDPWG